MLQKNFNWQFETGRFRWLPQWMGSEWTHYKEGLCSVVQLTQHLREQKQAYQIIRKTWNLMPAGVSKSSSQ